MKKMKNRWIMGLWTGLVLLGLACGAQAANTYYVAKTGSDSGGDGSTITPWSSVTNALRVASPGDAIFVGNGVYTQSVSFAGKTNVTIRGGYDGAWTWDPANQTTMILTTNGASVVIIPAGANSNTLSYLTLRGGTLTDKAGIEFTAGAPYLFVEGCVIVSNRYGLHVSAQNVNPFITLRNTVVARNTMGGIYSDKGNWGAKSYCYLYNCTVADNGGHGFYSYGGAGDIQDLTPIAVNSLFTGNNGVGVFKDGSSSGATISNCLFYANTNGPVKGRLFAFFGVKSGRDPKYVGLTDYRVQSDSPAAAAGLDLSAFGVVNDIGGAARPDGAWDMGAYEGNGGGEGALVNAAYVKPTGSDVTGDGSSSLPWATINFALGKLAPYGSLYVAGGTYTESVTFGPEKSNVALRGGYDPATWNWAPGSQVTVIDGKGLSPIVIPPNADSNVISCLTLKGGTNAVQAGILFNGVAQRLFVDGCTIVSNLYGVYQPRKMIQTPIFRNTVIARNSSNGLFFGDQPPSSYICYLYNCTIADNGADGYYAQGTGDGGWNDAVPMAKNTLFTGNKGYGLNKGGGGSGGSLQNCLFFGNTNGPLLCFVGVSMLSGNKSGGDPKYTNPAGLDYSMTADSPAVAAGMDLSVSPYVVTNDIVGVARPQGAAWDMGPFESAGAGEPAPPSSVYVSTNGSDTAGDGAAGNPWVTIQYALGRVAPSGIVHVSAGTYNENVSFGPGSSWITLQGGYTPGTWVWSPTNQIVEISCGTNSPVTIAGGANSNVLSYLTLKGGTATKKAGVEFTGSASSLIVEGCTIVSNRYGIFNPRLVSQTLTLRNVLIARNAADGIYFGDQAASKVYLYNCTLADNGGNGYFTYGVWADAVPVAKNTVFSGNNGNGLRKEGTGTGGSMENCLFFGNTNAPTYAPTGFSDLGNNKTGRDPKYVQPSALDYRVAADSPAAAAGKDLAAAPYLVINDILGVSRPQPAGSWDMGAYEGAGGGESGAIPLAYVRTTGNDTTGDGSTNLPWATIGYAMGHTLSSGRVFVAGGTYPENLSFASDKKWAMVRGGYDPATWNWSPSNQATVVNGNGNSPVLVAGGADSNTVSYLTLKGGTNSGRAGIEFSGSASNLFIEGCSIVSNYYGIYNPRLVSQTLALRNTLIARNASYGIYFGDQAASTVYLYNCTIADNGADGYYAYGQWADAVPVARNTLFTGNNGYGLRKDGFGTGGVIQNCLFHGNTNGPLLYYLGMSITNGNKSGRNPKYLNAAGLDCRVAVDSPAAAAGMDLSGMPYFVTNDLLGVLRPQGAAWDMGVYESANAGEPALATGGYVSKTGSDSNDGSAGSPWATIQYAVGKAAPSSTIRVSAGSYAENVQFGPGTWGVTLQGGYTPGTWTWSPRDQIVEINGSTKSPVAICGSANSNLLSYLTLSGGSAAAKAGVEFTGSAPYLFVEGCSIVSNRYGIYLPGSLAQNLTVRNVLIARNTAQGIFFDTAWNAGGICYLYNCTIADNGSNGFHSAGNSSGGAYDLVPVVKNTLFTGNNGYGIYKGGSGGGASMAYCLFYGNANGATNWFNGFADLGNNMMTSPPLYQPGAVAYQLGEASPALNSGTDLTAQGVTNDICGFRRPQRGVYDRGAYELATALGSVFRFR